MTQEEYVSDAVDLLKKLITTPSVSRNEKDAADIMEQTIRKYGFEPHREANNIWIIDPHYDESRPTLLLNAHIDTVKPVASWTRNPFSPDVEEGVLYGLGSNDCGGGLCSLLQIFRILTAKPQQYNLIYLASAEEEVSGKDGITRALPLLPHIDLAIVGEPTGMNPAVAEKGLMVVIGYLIAENGTCGGVHDQPDVSFDATDLDIGFISSEDIPFLVRILFDKWLDTDGSGFAVVSDLLVGNSDVIQVF